MKRTMSLSNILSDISGKKVLVRVDFNVPLNEQGEITDDTRIIAALPTITALLSHGAAVIVMSHLGRPKGTQNPQFSLKPCAARLSELLGISVALAPDCVGDDVLALKQQLRPGEILLLENLRFHDAETKPENDPSFAEKLSLGADFYVNDAFGTAHRKHSSTYTIARYFPNKAVSGFLMEKEIEFLGTIINNPERPFYAIVGGAKVSSKIGVVHSLIEKVDGIIIGGGMAYTFMKAQGINIGDSIYEEEFIETATKIMQRCAEKKVKILFPEDIIVANTFANDAETHTVLASSGIDKGYQGMDIGPRSREIFALELSKAKTILWNGPLGVYEMDSFSHGTEAIAHILADSRAITIVGGGDCVAAVNAAGVASSISHISTGGGASLEYIEHGSLPGIEVLSTL